MRQPLVRSFASLDAATAARAALIEAGLSPDAMNITVIQDEAGPVEGNFLIGNGRTTDGSPPGAVLAGPDVPYESNFAQVVTRGVNLLMVQPANDAEERQSMQVLESMGGLDVDAAALRGQPS